MSLWIIIQKRLKQLQHTLATSDLTLLLIVSVVLIIVGTIVYSLIEKWTPLEALYATIITITTVGYGDLSPSTEAGRVFAIIFTLLAIGIVGYALSSLAAYTIERQAKKLEERLRKRRMKRIEELDKHMIVCGVDNLGARVAQEFYNLKTPFVMIEEDENLLRRALLFMNQEYFQKKIQSFYDITDADFSEYENRSIAELADELDVAYLQADPTDDAILVQAGIERARGLLATLPDDRDNLAIVVGARALADRFKNEDFHIMSRVEDNRYMRKLYLSGANFVRLPAVITGFEMASHIAHPEIGLWWYSYLGGTGQALRYRQESVSDQPDWVNQTVEAIHRLHNLLIVAVKRGEAYLSPPPHDTKLQANDILIVLGTVD